MHRFMRRDAEAQVYEEEGAGARRGGQPRKAYHVFAFGLKTQSTKGPRDLWRREME